MITINGVTKAWYGDNQNVYPQTIALFRSGGTSPVSGGGQTVSSDGENAFLVHGRLEGLDSEGTFADSEKVDAEAR
jgi:hypothetical protein